MASEPTNLYPITERDLHVYTIIAGQWLKTRKPAVVKKVYRVLRDCGVLGSVDALSVSIRKLVKEQWLTPRPYGEKLHRYVPTLRGFAEYSTTWEKMIEDIFMGALSSGDVSSLLRYHDSLDVVKCIEQHIPESAQVKEIGRALATLVDVTAFKDVSLPLQYVDLARAVEEARPVDIVDWGLVEQVVSRLPALQCILLNAKANDLVGELLTALTHACRRGLAALWDDAVQKVVSGYLSLAQYCSHLGVQFDVKPRENLLRNLATLTRCGNT